MFIFSFAFLFVCCIVCLPVCFFFVCSAAPPKDPTSRCMYGLIYFFFPKGDGLSHFERGRPVWAGPFSGDRQAIQTDLRGRCSEPVWGGCPPARKEGGGRWQRVVRRYFGQVCFGGRVYRHRRRCHQVLHSGYTHAKVCYSSLVRHSGARCQGKWWMMFILMSNNVQQCPSKFTI